MINTASVIMVELTPLMRLITAPSANANRETTATAAMRPRVGPSENSLNPNGASGMRKDFTSVGEAKIAVK